MKASVVLFINGASFAFKSTEDATTFLYKHNTAIKDQRSFVKEIIDKQGFITRNQALSVFITRLSSIIKNLKDEGYNIEGRYGEKGVDYIYEWKDFQPNLEHIAPKE